MDPLTLANAFATIVQLIGVYRQENQDPAAANQQKFFAWLDYHRHEEIKNLICNTAGLQTEVLNLLRQDSARILSQLNSINTTLATLLSRVDGFGSLSRLMLPSVELSDQAVFILRQFVHSKARLLQYGQYSNTAILQPDNGEPFSYLDAVFLDDDFETLERSGFLANRGSDGLSHSYGITRAAAKYIELLDSQPSTPNAQPPQ